MSGVIISDGGGNLVIGYTSGKEIKQVEKLTFPATADATQGEWVSFSNVLDTVYTAWLDIDANGTEPNGILYGNTTHPIVVPIVTGGTAIQNAAAFVAAVEADLDFAYITLTDNEDGTVLVSQGIAGACGDALSRIEDETEDGNILVAKVAEGTSYSISRQDFIPKQNLKVVVDNTKNTLFLITDHTERDGKGSAVTTIPFTDVLSPVTASISELLTQVNTWTASATNGSQNGVCSNYQTVTPSDDESLASAGWIQPRALGGDVVFIDEGGNMNTITMELNEVSLFRVSKVMATGTTPDMGLVVYF